MPVREAIGRLEQNGLVVRVPHRGAVVADLTPAELAHVYATRLVLEVEATRLGCAAVGPADVAAMRTAYDAMVAAVAPAAPPRRSTATRSCSRPSTPPAATRCCSGWSRTSGSGAAPSSCWARTPPTRSLRRPAPGRRSGACSRPSRRTTSTRRWRSPGSRWSRRSDGSGRCWPTAWRGRPRRRHLTARPSGGGPVSRPQVLLLDVEGAGGRARAAAARPWPSARRSTRPRRAPSSSTAACPVPGRPEPGVELLQPAGDVRAELRAQARADLVVARVAGQLHPDLERLHRPGGHRRRRGARRDGASTDPWTASSSSAIASPSTSTRRRWSAPGARSLGRRTPADLAVADGQN